MSISPKKAKLHLRYAAMNAGKSTHLLQVAYNYEETGQAVLIYTAAVDDRYGVGKVTSRLGVSRSARMFDKDTDFLKDIPDGLACVLVDEAQFLAKEQVRQLHKVAAERGIPVICFGLRTDFRGEPFEGSAWLLALAEDVEEMKAICACGRKATMNVKVSPNGTRISEGNQVEIGGNARYRSVCSACFYAGR